MQLVITFNNYNSQDHRHHERSTRGSLTGGQNNVLCARTHVLDPIPPHKILLVVLLSTGCKHDGKVRTTMKQC